MTALDTPPSTHEDILISARDDSNFSGATINSKLNLCDSANAYTEGVNNELAGIDPDTNLRHKFNMQIKQEACLRRNRRGGGTSIYVNNNISYKTRNDLKLKPKYYESVFVEVNKNIFNTNRNIIIGAIYNPPNGCLKRFNEELTKLLTKIQKEKKYAYIQGDFNINSIVTSVEVIISFHSGALCFLFTYIDRMHLVRSLCIVT